MEVTATQKLDWDQHWDFHVPDSHQSGDEDLVLVLNVKTLTHSQQQPQGPKSHKKKPTIRLTIRINALSPQTSLLYCILVLNEVKCKTHTQQQTQLIEITFDLLI